MKDNTTIIKKISKGGAGDKTEIDKYEYLSYYVSHRIEKDTDKPEKQVD